MAFNFISFCNAETDSTTFLNKRSRDVGDDSKLDESALSEQKKLITRLQEELTKEHETCQQLSKEIKSLNSQLTQYQTEINEKNYEKAQLQQLLKEKQTHTNHIDANYAQLQEKMTKLQDKLQQYTLQREDHDKKYRESETNEAEKNNAFVEELKEKDERISALIEEKDSWKVEIAGFEDKLKRLKEENESLQDDRRRADGLQELLEAKSLQIMRLKDEIQQLTQLRDVTPIIQLQAFELPLEYFQKHLGDYKNDETNLLKIWNKIDIDGNDQILLSSSSLNTIFKQFIQLIKLRYIDEFIVIDNAQKYSLQQKECVNILNESQIFELKTNSQPLITKKMFLNDFMSLIMIMDVVGVEGEVDDDAKDEKDDEDEKEDDNVNINSNGFDQLQFVATSPTIIGIDSNIFSIEEYCKKLNTAIDTLTNNPKERILKSVNVLIKCNDTQRSEINKELLVGVTLRDKFALYSKNKNVLKLLDLMLRPLSECAAEWINKAINKKNEDDVIEILFTKTNQEIKLLKEKYSQLYETDLCVDIENAFNNKDQTFVLMCNTLIELIKRNEMSVDAVDKKWAANDVKRIKEYLNDAKNKNNNDDTAWNILCDLVVNRSWSHLNILCNIFETQTQISLIYRLKKANPNKSAARKAALTILCVSHSVHTLFAEKLSEILKNSKTFAGIDHDALQRILLSRSQIDLAEIEHQFTNNQRFGDGKTTRQWIEDCTQSSCYQHILLSLLGLTSIQMKDRVVNVPIDYDRKEDNDDDNKNNVPLQYRDGLLQFNPSIIAKPYGFNAITDANQISSWIKECETDTKAKGALKERLADLLTSRDARQRGEILRSYPNVMDEIGEKIKKGQVVALCGRFLCASIAASDACIIEKAQLENDLHAIGDILCTQNNTQIGEIIGEYKRLYCGSGTGTGLVQKISEFLSQRGSVRIILDSLLRCKRNENALNIDIKRVENDVAFLINTKKFKSEEKKRFVEIFCNNNWKYIREINRIYGMRSSNVNLEKLIKSQLGSDSGYFTLILLKYSCDPSAYFARKLFILGSKFDKNRGEIAKIFLLRSEIDLNDIRTRFANEQYGKKLDKWIQDKSKGSKFGYFLAQILTSIDRHNKDIDLQLNVKPKYDDLLLQTEILNNDKKRQESLDIFSSENCGLIKFLTKYLQSKIVDKMWSKLDSKKKGYIEFVNFPDLIAFIVILYKVKVFQKKTKSKNKPEIDNKRIRSEIEHIAVWIATKYIYNDNDNDDTFKLTQHDFQNKFPGWCQQYIDVNGVLEDF